MKTNYSGVQNKYKPLTLELTEAEIISKYQGENWRYCYPRHIPYLHYKSHRQHRSCVNNSYSLPLTCKLSVERSPLAENSDAIITILQSQLKDKKAKQAHLDSVRRNLERRLQAAKVSGNHHLIDLLTEESQQLEMSV
ncbi:DUF4278 domain-containing protein [Pleurocapsales cyanobacterium LEGE 06147]|nr:DUF4278 domain-containing protein [Pleurocapsales cyanobacterium LEGE 06147]